MESIENLVPKDKSDTETAERLFGHSHEHVKPIIPALLEWLQDTNWPVAYPVSRYLASIAEYIQGDIVNILRTNDSAWKYYTLRSLVANRPLSPEVTIELQRLQHSIDQDDIDWEIPQLAMELLEGG